MEQISLNTTEKARKGGGKTNRNSDSPVLQRLPKEEQKLIIKNCKKKKRKKRQQTNAFNLKMLKEASRGPRFSFHVLFYPYREFVPVENFGRSLTTVFIH